MKQSILSEPVTQGNTSFANRIVMAPMTRCRAIGYIPNDLMATYYAQRSSAGLIITEGTAPGANGLGYARIPGIFSKEQVAGWKKVTDAVHAKGGKIFIQLMHTGRVSHPANMPEGSKVIAPSAISANGDMWTDASGMQKTAMPEEMTTEDIRTTIAEFAQAAANAVEAGFDGVELHGANGYLLEQFLNPHSNTRTDGYGGSVENRCRFVLEAAAAVGKAIGFDKTGIRLSPYSTFNTMPHYNDIVSTYTSLAGELNRLNLVYLHLVDYAARNSAEGPVLIKTIRETFKQLLILNGGYNRERAEAAIENGEADLVSFGTPFIANPDLPYRITNNIAYTKPDTATFYTSDAKGYTDYAAYQA